MGFLTNMQASVFGATLDLLLFRPGITPCHQWQSLEVFCVLALKRIREKTSNEKSSRRKRTTYVEIFIWICSSIALSTYSDSLVADERTRIAQ